MNLRSVVAAADDYLKLACQSSRPGTITIFARDADKLSLPHGKAPIFR